MMKIKTFFIIVCAFLVMSSRVSADQGEFKKSNPDGLKFEFARSFIASMAYFQSIEVRLKESDRISDAVDEKKHLQWNRDRLAKDNLDLRVAKNYMIKYFNVGNALMRKVVDSYAVTCDELIALNRRERELWQQWPQMRKVDDDGNVDMKEFLDAQADLSDQRKSVMRRLVETAVLMTKVLLNEDVREKQVRKRLALTHKEREKLIKKLDAYAGDNLDWGMKPGQTFLQSAQAVVREVLEDPTYLNVDE
jgi:hypothetical protein